jgi:hypothetical protein
MGTPGQVCAQLRSAGLLGATQLARTISAS